MREFLKVMCVVALMVGLLGAFIAWNDRPSPLVWWLRYGMIGIGVLALAGFLFIHFRRDIAPDLLYKHFGKYFDRGGFCFCLGLASEQGVCVLVIPFQNRHERSCRAQIAIRSAPGFLGGRRFEGARFDLEAGPAAFGIARVPIPMPTDCQGRRLRFEVAASVKYPQGKGRMLRFRDGVRVGSEQATSEFGSAALTVGLALFGHIHMPGRPASIVMSVPANVSETLPTDFVPVIKTFWTLGDKEPPTLPSEGFRVG